jgi:hypothetical protein
VWLVSHVQCQQNLRDSGMCPLNNDNISALLVPELYNNSTNLLIFISLILVKYLCIEFAISFGCFSQIYVCETEYYFVTNKYYIDG